MDSRQKETLESIADSIAKKWIAAFNKPDIEELLELYHDDARHFSYRVEYERPESRGWLRGKGQLRGWWQGKFQSLAGLSYELNELTIGVKTDEDMTVLLEYTRKAPEQPDKYMFELLRIRNGLIYESVVLRELDLTQYKDSKPSPS